MIASNMWYWSIVWANNIYTVERTREFKSPQAAFNAALAYAKQYGTRHNIEVLTISVYLAAPLPLIARS